MTDRFWSNRTKLRPGALPAVEAWAAEMNARRDEIAATLADEGIDLEVWILEEAYDGFYLVSLLETDDYDRAIAVYEQSSHAIDEYHQRFLAENMVERSKLRILSAVRPS